MLRVLSFSTSHGLRRQSENCGSCWLPQLKSKVQRRTMVPAWGARTVGALTKIDSARLLDLVQQQYPTTTQVQVSRKNLAIASFKAAGMSSCKGRLTPVKVNCKSK